MSSNKGGQVDYGTPKLTFCGECHETKICYKDGNQDWFCAECLVSINVNHSIAMNRGLLAKEHEEIGYNRALSELTDNQDKE